MIDSNYIDDEMSERGFVPLTLKTYCGEQLRELSKQVLDWMCDENMSARDYREAMRRITEFLEAHMNADILKQQGNLN